MTESKQELLSALNERFSSLEPNEDARRLFEKINFSQFSEEQIRDFGDLFTHCLASIMDYFEKKSQKEIPKALEL